MGLERLTKPWALKDKKFHRGAASTAHGGLCWHLAPQLAEHSVPASCQHCCLSPGESSSNCNVKWVNKEMSENRAGRRMPEDISEQDNTGHLEE